MFAGAAYYVGTPGTSSQIIVNNYWWYNNNGTSSVADPIVEKSQRILKVVL
jgi:hypothetical protein